MLFDFLLLRRQVRTVLHSVTLKDAWLRRRVKILSWWLILVLLSLVALAVFQHKLHLTELKSESTRLFRVASQRVAQHDAHLNALAVITTSSISGHRRLFLDIARSINYFYPRIKGVRLLELEEVRQVMGSIPHDADIASAVSIATKTHKATYTLLSHPKSQAHYVLIKRKPVYGVKRYVLTLEIDATQLLAGVSSFWSREQIAVRLALPNGDVLMGPEEMEAAQFSQALGSNTQPLQLDIAMRLGIADLLPPLKIAGTVLIVSLFYLGVLLALWQRARTRAAEQTAKLRDMETQLTHASRVNAMGEMASGMAHELTQPLTAILAQAQAGLRLLEHGRADELAPVFHDTVLQSRRASSILERLRNWSRSRQDGVAVIDLRDVLHNVHALLTVEASQRNVQMALHMPEQPVPVEANQVEMEQVIHNLVRNGFEALENVDDARVDVSLAVSSGPAILEVSDNGEGIVADIIPQLFTPFYTTRDNGTGLGLTLCQRLVERAGGEITHVQSSAGATFRVALPLAADYDSLEDSEVAE